MDLQARHLQDTITTLEAQRGLLGDAVVDTALAPLRAQLERLQQAAQGQRLKQVSVLFIERAAPAVPAADDIAAANAHAHQQAAEAMTGFITLIEARRGQVLQVVGDTLLAAFGADTVAEDDAARAVQAGLAVLAAAAAAGPDAPAVRAGIHTGGVLLGGGVDGDGTIRGLTVNLAARMQQSAPPRSLRISQDTWRQVRGLFDLQAQPPLRVKGRDEPMLTYLVQGLSATPFADGTRGVEGLVTPMIGRERELSLLHTAWHSVRQVGTLHAVSVVAEAGLGKSRLLREFEQGVLAEPAGCVVWRARALPQTQQQPFGLLRDLLARHLGLSEQDSMELARARLVAGVAPVFAADGPALAEAHAHVLGHLIGLDFSHSPHLRNILDDARQLRSRALHTAAQLLRRAASTQHPLLLLLDDLHWADEGSLDFFAQVLKLNHDVPLLLLALTRPLLHERRPGWPGALLAHTTLALAPLATQGRDALADALLQRLDQPALLRPLLLERAAGNPFFMEELLKMLIDTGAVSIDGPVWRVLPERLQATQVPVTLTGVLQARLDSLPAAERQPLQQASVLGPVFSLPALAALDDDAPAALPALTRRTLLLEQDLLASDDAASAIGSGGSGGFGDGDGQDYAFVHQLLQQVTYGTVLKAPRQRWHSQAAAHLRSLTSARAAALAGEIGEHHERAGENALAAEAYTRAAEQAAAQFVHAAVVDFASRALMLLQGLQATPEDQPPPVLPVPPAELRWRALLVRNRALRHQGDLAAMHTDLDALQVLADHGNDDSRRAQILLRRAVAHSEAGDLHATAAGAREALALALACSAHAVAISAHAALAGALRVLGPADEALRVAHDGVALARQVGPPTAVSEMLNVLAATLAEQGELGAAASLFDECLALDRSTGSRYAEVTTLINLGECASRLGDRSRARSVLEQALLLTRTLGMRSTEVMALVNLSGLLQQQGDELALAHTLAADALAQAQAVGNREYAFHAQLALAQASLALADDDRAQSAFTAAHQVLHELDMAHLAVEPLAGLAQLALRRGEPDQARHHVEAVLAGSLEGTQQPLWIRLVCWQVLSSLKDPRAAEHLVLAHGELMALAAGMPDDSARQRLVHNVPVNRQIAAAWAARASGASV